MNKRPILMMAAAMTAALATVSVAASWLKQKDDNNTIKVVVATRDLQIGTRLQPAMLETVSWPMAAPIHSPLHKTEQAFDRVVNMPILRGEPIQETKLAAVGQQGGLSSVLKDGKRAVTVKVNEIVGVAGFALPGNFVDVMANIPDKDNNPVSKIVLERIQVLAVAQDVASTENKPRVVSAVTLEKATAAEIASANSVNSLPSCQAPKNAKLVATNTNAANPNDGSAGESTAANKSHQLNGSVGSAAESNTGMKLLATYGSSFSRLAPSGKIPFAVIAPLGKS